MNYSPWCCKESNTTSDLAPRHAGRLRWLSQPASSRRPVAEDFKRLSFYAASARKSLCMQNLSNVSVSQTSKSQSFRPGKQSWAS